MTIKKFYYFCEICKDLNLSHTAKRLFVTQQSLSYVIRTLEQELQCPLFSRSPSGLRLTEQGEYFYGQCRHILDELEQTCEVIHQSFNPTRTNLQISLDSCVYNMMMHLLPNRCGNCSVDYSYENTNSSLDSIQSGKSDAAILPQKLNAPDLQYTLLWRDPVCVILPKSHPLAQNPTVSITALCHEQLLIPHLFEPIYPTLLQDCAKMGTHFRNTITTPSPVVAIHKCAQGQGIILMDQQTLVNCVVNTSEIHVLPLSEPLFINLYCAHPRKRISSSLRSFIREIQSSAQSQT